MYFLYICKKSFNHFAGTPIYLHAHPEQQNLNQTNLFQFTNNIENYLQKNGIPINHKRAQPFVIQNYCFIVYIIILIINFM